MTIDEQQEEIARMIFGHYNVKNPKFGDNFFSEMGIPADPYYMYAQSVLIKTPLDISHFKVLQNQYGDILSALVLDFDDKIYKHLHKEIRQVSNSVKLDREKVKQIKEGKYYPYRLKKLNLEIIIQIITERFQEISQFVRIADVIHFLSDLETMTYLGETESGLLINQLNFNRNDNFVNLETTKFVDVEKEEILENYHKAALCAELKSGYMRGYYPLYKITEWIKEIREEDIFSIEPKVYEVINQCKSWRWTQGLPYDWTYIHYKDFLDGKHGICFDIENWNEIEVEPFVSPHFVPELIQNVKVNFSKVLAKRLREEYDYDGVDYFTSLFDGDFDKILDATDLLEGLKITGRRMYNAGADPDFEHREENKRLVFDENWFAFKYGRPYDLNIDFFRRHGDVKVDSISNISDETDLPTVVMKNSKAMQRSQVWPLVSLSGTR